MMDSFNQTLLSHAAEQYPTLPVMGDIFALLVRQHCVLAAVSI